MYYYWRLLQHGPQQLKKVLDILLHYNGQWLETLKEYFQWLERYQDPEDKGICYGLGKWTEWICKEPYAAKQHMTNTMALGKRT